jgi:hypothetical protein
MEIVPRPRRKTDFILQFDNRAAELGWRDAVAVRRNAMVDAWDWLTNSPLSPSPLCSPLRGQLGSISRGGIEHDRWQLKLDERDGIRICYFVVDNTVCIEKVHTRHPNETK